ncbi:MAG: ribbon-helix-helix domain-containing protein [Anaerolineae bacterium]
MTRWTLVISDETDKALRRYLAEQGAKKGALSDFVEAAVQRRLFELVVADIKERNSAFSQEDIMSAVDEALDEARS